MMDPEEQARVQIDKMLTDSGWIIQDFVDISTESTRVSTRFCRYL